MAEAAWKALVRQRVGSALDRVRVGGQRLHLANTYLVTPAYSADVARDRFSAVFGLLAQAAQDLDSAAVFLMAAEALTLIGGNPAGPSSGRLASLQDLDPQDAAVRTAMERIHICLPAAKEACAFAEYCRGHLSMCRALAESPGFPDALVHAHRELVTACLALRTAVRQTQFVWDRVTAALQILTP